MKVQFAILFWLLWTTVATASSTVEQLLANVGLNGKASVVLMDIETGRMVEAVNPRKALPPASVTKAVTVPYAISALGTDFRFTTQVIATGPIENGKVRGDLVLVGGGDPLLDTDGLFKMAEQLRAKGVKGVTGDFLFVDGAIANVTHLDREQPDYVGYNPAISGLNLNFNRVFFQWKGSAVSVTAKGEDHAPSVEGVQVAISERKGPVFKHAKQKGKEVWTVARSAMGDSGSRWLPVREPGSYAAEVFRTLAQDNGIALPEPKRSNQGVSGTVLVSESGANLVALSRGMLKFSTNLSAEIVGIRASEARGKSLADHKASARAMTQWAKRHYGVSAISFNDHSGLNDASSASGRALAEIMRKEAKTGLYPALLKSIPIEGSTSVTVRAKTGTLNFVSALSGIIEGPRGTYAFAILMADEGLRRQGKRDGVERPVGARSWKTKARGTQKAILGYWAEAYLQ
ncbi:MAG: D-alanyl-D-alanine carboxypeptidase/D-alanyl-D-alanine-endopeptidase [Pseudomonadota bacterium]